MMKSILIAAALTVAGAAGASAQDFRAQDDGYSSGRARYGYDNSSSALGRYCPPGQYPHSWPNGQGVRCEIADGVFSGQ